jgi:hypothetical protein
VGQRLFGTVASLAAAVALLGAMAPATWPEDLEPAPARPEVPCVDDAPHGVLASSLRAPDVARHAPAGHVSPCTSTRHATRAQPPALSLASARDLLRWQLAHSTTSGLH